MQVFLDFITGVFSFFDYSQIFGLLLWSFVALAMTCYLLNVVFSR